MVAADVSPHEAPNWAWGFFARRSQPHCRGMLGCPCGSTSRLAPGQLGATNVTGFTLMTTKQAVAGAMIIRVRSPRPHAHRQVTADGFTIGRVNLIVGRHKVIAIVRQFATTKTVSNCMKAILANGARTPDVRSVPDVPASSD